MERIKKELTKNQQTPSMKGNSTLKKKKSANEQKPKLSERMKYF